MEFDELKRQFGSGQPSRVSGTARPSSAHDEVVLEAARAAAGRMRRKRRRADRDAVRPPWMAVLASPGGRTRLLATFSLIFVAVFGVAAAVAAHSFHGMLQRNARAQALHDAQLMMETALAMRSYTVDQVKPVVEGMLDAGRHAPFRPQTVPAFANAELFAQLRRKYPDYLYKEAALNPTNPRNRAVGWEQDLIKDFKSRPELKEFSGEHESPRGRSMFLARPVRPHMACLECHSTPARAPTEMLRIYGTANGFGWTEGDVVAAQIVSVPVSVPARMADGAFRRLLWSLALVGLGTLIVLDLLLYAAMSLLARRVDEVEAPEQTNDPDAAPPGSDRR